MQRAFQLARQGAGLVSPNPMVGCVIAAKGQIIGEGFHHQFGGPHAEVVAIQSVQDPALLKEATAYVTLEPCSHHGKTPPCCDLLIKHQIKRVIIANVDPNPQVQGKGINRMRESGVEVIAGTLAEEGRLLNRRFFTFHLKKRPYIILKWAQTSDGFIARKNYDSKWISSRISRQLVHRWRAEEDAILVGKNTVLYDNPSLTARDWKGKHPVRIVLDHRRSLTNDYQLFKDGHETWRVVAADSASAKDVAISHSNFLMGLMEELCRRNIQSLIVEGGTTTLNTFLEAGCWDEARVFTSEAKFKEGISAPKLYESPKATDIFGPDKLEIYENHQD